MTWTYLNYYEPLFLPIGLLILIMYSQIQVDKCKKSKKSKKSK